MERFTFASLHYKLHKVPLFIKDGAMSHIQKCIISHTVHSTYKQMKTSIKMFSDHIIINHHSVRDKHLFISKKKKNFILEKKCEIQEAFFFFLNSEATKTETNCSEQKKKHH